VLEQNAAAAHAEFKAQSLAILKAKL